MLIPKIGRLSPGKFFPSNYQDWLKITWKKKKKEKKKPFPQNFFLLRTAGSISPLTTLPQWFVPRGSLLHAYFSSSEMSPGQNVKLFCFCPWLLADPACRNHGEALGGKRFLFSTHLKVCFFGWESDFSAWTLQTMSVSAVCLTCSECLAQ